MTRNVLYVALVVAIVGWALSMFISGDLTDMGQAIQWLVIVALAIRISELERRL